MIPQVIKLSNGENIICTISESENPEQLKVTSPLKMDIFNKITEKGAVESLGLSRWIQPYSDEPFFKIQKSSVVIITPASEGLCRYYEHVVHTIGNMILKEDKDEAFRPTKEELDMIEEEEHFEEMEEFLEMFESDTIH